MIQSKNKSILKTEHNMLINRKIISAYSPLPVNYNYDEVMLYVPIAEEVWVKKTIGEDLYNKIQEEVDKNELSDETNALFTEGCLLQYIAYATCLEGLPFIAYKFTEVGVVKSKSDNSESVDGKQLSYIEQHLRRQVEFLKETVSKYICQRPDYYPEADFCACGCDCCSNGKGLIMPNPNYQLFTNRRKRTDLK